jgi:D-alanyl-D-alanine dipeptidase
MRCEHIKPDSGFRHLSSITDITVDLRYASSRNFVGRDLYGALDCAWLHELAAAGLESAVVNGIENEWWHFDRLDRRHVRQHFIRIE